jgi:hypothetical protein
VKHLGGPRYYPGEGTLEKIQTEKSIASFTFCLRQARQEQVRLGHGGQSTCAHGMIDLGGMDIMTGLVSERLPRNKTSLR